MKHTLEIIDGKCFPPGIGNVLPLSSKEWRIHGANEHSMSFPGLCRRHMDVVLLPSRVASPGAWTVSSLEGYVLLFQRVCFRTMLLQGVEASR